MSKRFYVNIRNGGFAVIDTLTHAVMVRYEIVDGASADFIARSLRLAVADARRLNRWDDASLRARA